MESLQPVRTDLILGAADIIETVAANYRCGHCNSHSHLRRDQDGHAHVATFHDAGCPVLEGVLSSIPDTVRAAGIPDTFKAR